MSARTPSEQFVYDVCTKSFFSLWSYLNPIREDGIELCDILVKFGDNLIIISVKNSIYNENAKDPNVAIERWKKRAINRSVRQILGAENYLLRKRTFNVKPTPKGGSLNIKDVENLRIHRVSVSLGSKGMISFSQDSSTDKFVHIFEEKSFWIILKELDTISDFVDYLSKKEDFLRKPHPGITLHGEEDLLAQYLMGNHSFPDGKATHIYLDAGIYEDMIQRPEYAAKKREDRISYQVDEIINAFIKHASAGTLLSKTPLVELEQSLRFIAAENRLNRRMLARSIHERVSNGPNDVVATRVLRSEQFQILYIIVAAPRNTSREVRRNFLHIRCHVAIGLLKDKLDKFEAVGIATEKHAKKQEHSYDLLYLSYPEWTDEDQREMERIQRDYNVFRNTNFQHSHENEYPETES